jgi:AcrR family transcriptional regulator
MTDQSVIVVYRPMSRQNKKHLPLKGSVAKKSAPAKPRDKYMKPQAKSVGLKKPGKAEESGQKKRAGRPRLSSSDAEAKRHSILEAALQVFSQHGFEAARLDDVARRAKVAKGTLYLYYPNKEAMFEALVRSAAEPLLDDMSAIARQHEGPPEQLLESIFALFRHEILGTNRKLVVRLIIAEGARFPELAQFYHREVITRVIATLEAVARKLHDEGRLASDGPLLYPQLIAAPLLLALIWDGLFAQIDPLDVEGLLAAHAKLLTTAKRRKRR